VTAPHSATDNSRNVWVAAARPKTLPAAVAPVMVGTAAASLFSPGRFLLTLMVALALQVGVNYANDYFDGIGGVDTAARLGPARAVASGEVTPAQMRGAMIASFAVAALAGLLLGLLAGWELIAVGVLALLAAAGYSGGPKPYASAGLGELFVFVFFGVVATVGSTYAQDERIVAASVVASFTPGLIAVALLLVNNLRDIPTDTQAAKRTLSVRIGDPASRRLIVACIMGAFVPPALVAAMTSSLWPLLAWLALPLAAQIVTRLRAAQGRALVAVLGGTGRLQLALGIAFATGIVMA
jgi:1,4-dihydroxy-2-naphthoate octaprenyltransferase